MKTSTIEGNIVEEYKIGNTTIKICDSAYKDKTPEDIERILKRIMEIGIRIYEKEMKE
ncbi:MAG: hypothetical protein QJR05_14150 [Thermoanaerobacterium sp.]|nr:hypothetical protein [Thermoanaerobacterium sp.]